MMDLPGPERSSMISLAVLIQYTSVTDRQTDGRTDGRTDGQTDRQTDRQTPADAERRAVKTVTTSETGNRVVHVN